ncbi:protein-disulfide reductase DsbD [Pseudoalteromonas sp. MMG010]|uniref:protein-disulfide reductase DsbD n=1 Tax=Pseudoalteromonas sp. MMG010 TaxID=2822685 RepID=UPI001B3A2A3E|nr:protein-disulfide reductase DsbD [Pseudoalteromonas sp. MMG010]MBQ4832711.1 protein-disulfide reductase DsbD [Pseudoalteromonas sp. MMG010]
MRWLFFCLLFIASAPSLSANNSFLNDFINDAPQQRFLPVDQAFVFNFSQQGSEFDISWDIAPGYYLYKKKIELIAKNATIKVGDLGLGEIIEDEFFGKTEVFFNRVSLTSHLSHITTDAVVKIRYQGCAEAGLCYPPEVISVPLSLIHTEQATASEKSALSAPQSIQNAPNKNTNTTTSELTFAERLASQGLLTNLVIFFVLGVGLAFTPCVFPMFPILSSLIAGQQNLSTKKAFILSFVYIQGMAVTYAILGLVVAALGGQVQGYLQHPYVLISFSLLFVLLAMSMFGWYEIKLPSGLMNKLTHVSNKQQGGNYLGVFLMGVLSGLIASPCTTAPLSAALLFVAQSGDYFIGGITLYVLSLGMGLPLLLLGTSGGKLLPKAGAWMQQVKTLFGFIMLAIPLILLERIVAFNIILLLAGGLALAIAVYLHYWQSSQRQSKSKTALWLIATLLVLTSFTLVKQALWPQKAHTQQVKQENTFTKVADLAQLKTAVAKANKQGMPVMVDLYADWCVACKEFEHYTFPQAQVQSEFKHFTLIQIDLTQSDNETIEVMDEYSVFGLPSILFFNTQGKELNDLRVTGFLNADDFANHLSRVRANAQ